MLRIRLLGMTLVALLAFGGVASGHVFEYSAVNAIKRVTNATQVFKTGGGLTVECTTDAVSSANSSAGNQLTLLADVSYSGCTATALKLGATVTTAKYLLSADETANLRNTVVINIPVANCHITVKAQNTLKTIKYKNTGKDLVVEPNVSGILSEGSGGECGTGDTSKGTYTGSTVVELVGGTISWK
jgi:hypothetical protein